MTFNDIETRATIKSLKELNVPEFLVDCIGNLLKSRSIYSEEVGVFSKLLC